MPDTIFAGPLAPKNKKDLQEIAESFGISSEGRRDQLLERIKQYISDNEDALRNDARYSGLLKRGRGRKGSQPPSTNDPSEAEVEPVETKVTRLSPIVELTPTIVRERDARDISIALKNVLDSPTKPVSSASTGGSISHTSVDLSTKNDTNVSEEDEEDEVEEQEEETYYRAASATPVPTPRISTKQTTSTPGSISTKMALKPASPSPIEPVRNLLSNSRNIWSLSSVGELVYIFIAITPWQYYPVPNTSLLLPYPPASSFQTPVFWLTLFHWILPTIVIPASVGNLITFFPNLETTTAPFDPLTAAIVRLAANALYSHPTYTTSLGTKVTTDVLGERWRVVSASVGVAFAFAEVTSLIFNAVTRQ